MKTRKVLLCLICLAIAALLPLCSSARLSAASAKEDRQTRVLTLVNKCGHDVWVGMQGREGAQRRPLDPSFTGFLLPHDVPKRLHVDSTFDSGRIWARTGCAWRNGSWGANLRFVCDTGDCGSEANGFGVECRGVGGQPPATLAELTLRPAGNTADDGNTDFYDISNVDGHSVETSITPSGPYSRLEGHVIEDEYNCGVPHCRFDMSSCPPELRLDTPSGTACLSICAATRMPEQREQHRKLRRIFDSPDLSSSVCCDCWPVSQGAPGGCADHLCCPPASFCLENGLTLDHCCGLQGADCCGCFNGKSKHCCSPHDPTLARKPSHGGTCRVEDWPLIEQGAFKDQRYDTLFKKQCPHAYSWQFDDLFSTYQCRDADYTITFCEHGPYDRLKPPSPHRPEAGSTQCLLTKHDSVVVINVQDTHGPVQCINGPYPIGQLLEGDQIADNVELHVEDISQCAQGDCFVLLLGCGSDPAHCCQGAPVLRKLQCTMARHEDEEEGKEEEEKAEEEIVEEDAQTREENYYDHDEEESEQTTYAEEQYEEEQGYEDRYEDRYREKEEEEQRQKEEEEQKQNNRQKEQQQQQQQQPTEFSVQQPDESREPASRQSAESKPASQWDASSVFGGVACGVLAGIAGAFAWSAYRRKRAARAATPIIEEGAWQAM